MSVSPANNNITTSVTHSASWSKATGPTNSIYDLKIQNKTSYAINIREITIRVGVCAATSGIYTGSGSTTNITLGNSSARLYNGNTAVTGATNITYNTSTRPAVSCASKGSSSSSGYFNDISSNNNYRVTFTLNAGAVQIPSGNNVTLKLCKDNESSTAITTRYADDRNDPVVYWERVGQTMPVPRITTPSTTELNYREDNNINVTKSNADSKITCILYYYNKSDGGNPTQIGNRNNTNVADFTRTFKPSSRDPENAKIRFFATNTNTSSTVNYYLPTKKNSGVVALNVKLGPPTKPALTASGEEVSNQVTIGETLTFTLNAGSPNPSGTKTPIQWKNTNTEIGNGSSYNVTEGLSSNQDYHVELYNRCGSFHNSDTVSSNKVTRVVFCPEKMADNGFTVTWNISGKKVSWSAFPVSKHSGLFNKYKLELINVTSSSTVVGQIVGDNTPSQAKSNVNLTALFDRAVAGNSYKIRLTAYCNYNGTNYLTTSDNTNIFNSPSFSVSGTSPEIVMKYPIDSAATCNSKPRLIFEIDPGSPASLFSLQVSTDGGASWTTHYSPFTVDSNILYCDIDNDGIYHIVYVLSSSASNRTVKIKCTNTGNLDSDTIQINLEYITLDNVSRGEGITADSVVYLNSALQRVINGYPSEFIPQSVNIDTINRDMLTDVDIRKLLDSTIDFLNVWMTAISDIYGTLSSSHSTATNVVDISRETGLSRGDFANAKPLEDINYYVGNIFNHIIDGLKYML